MKANLHPLDLERRSGVTETSSIRRIPQRPSRPKLMDDDRRFIDEHRPLVLGLAQRIRGRFELSVEMDDLIAFGVEGLLEARARYDASRGVQFRTFAYYRVQGAILDGVRRMAYLSRRAHARLRAAEAQQQLCEALGEERAAAPERRAQVEGSLRSLESTLSRLTAAFVISALGQDQESNPNPEGALLEKELQSRMQRAVDTLPEREKALVKGFYFEGRRFDEVAQELGVSKSWASRLHGKALDLLREALSH